MYVVAMAMFVLFTGLIGYALYMLIRKAIDSFNSRIKRMVNAAEVAADAFKYANGDEAMKSS